MKKSKYVLFLITILGLFVLSACTPKQEEVKTETEKKSSYYFTADEGGSISKIDASTNEVIDTFILDGAPHNVQISPDRKVLGATLAVGMEEGQSHGSMSMNGSAIFYDANTNKPIKKIEVGNHPAHIVFTEDGKYALVTNNEDDNISVIDAKNYTVTQTVSTGNGPHGFRISKDSKFAYVANMGEDTVSVIDISTFKEIKKIKVGKAPVTTGITSDGKTLVVTLNGENAMAIVDLATDSIVKIPVGIGPAQIYLQSDDKYAFVANQGTEENPSNTVSKIDMKTKEVIATIEAGKGAHGIVLSSDNKFLYITNMFDNTVSVIDNSQNKVISTVSVGEIPNGITYK